jgi:hypothetical protein
MCAFEQVLGDHSTPSALSCKHYVCRLPAAAEVAAVMCLLLQAFLSPSNLNIVMEYVPDGSLLSHIQDNRWEPTLA